MVSNLINASIPETAAVLNRSGPRTHWPPGPALRSCRGPERERNLKCAERNAGGASLEPSCARDPLATELALTLRMPTQRRERTSPHQVVECQGRSPEPARSRPSASPPLKLRSGRSEEHHV